MSRVEPQRNVYIGHRYVPLLVGEWDNSIEYEGLSIVTHKGASYTSKKRTPPGIDIENTEFWVLTGNYNAQIEYYRQDVGRVQQDIETLRDNTEREILEVRTHVNEKIQETRDYVDGEVSETRQYVNDEISENKEYVDSNVEDLTTYVNDEVRKNKEYVDDGVSESNKKIEYIQGINPEKTVSFSLIDDDGHHQAFNKLKPMLEERGLKGTFSLATSYINTPGFLSENQIHEMIENGHEMVNHAHTNARLATLTENEIRHEFEESQRILKNMGIETNVHVYPNGSYNSTVVNILKEYFDVGVDDFSGRNSYPLSTFAIKRIGIGPWASDDFDYIKEQIDGAIENNEMAVLMTHIGQHNESQDLLLERVLDYIISQNVEFTTFSDSYNKHKNIIEHGDYDPETQNSSFSLGVDGSLKVNDNDVGYIKKLEKNSVTSDTGYNQFDYGKITYCYIDGDNLEGFPSTGHGLLETNAIGASSDFINIFQKFYRSGSYTVYKRHVVWDPENGNIWGEWNSDTQEIIHRIDEYDTNLINKPISEYSIGVTSNIITSDYSSGTPEDGGGVLTTYKYHSSFNTYNWQEFHDAISGNHYKRTFTQNGTPNDFIKMTP